MTSQEDKLLLTACVQTDVRPWGGAVADLSKAGSQSLFWFPCFVLSCVDFSNIGVMGWYDVFCIQKSMLKINQLHTLLTRVWIQLESMFLSLAAMLGRPSFPWSLRCVCVTCQEPLRSLALFRGSTFKHSKNYPSVVFWKDPCYWCSPTPVVWEFLDWGGAVVRLQWFKGPQLCGVSVVRSCSKQPAPAHSENCW